ESEPRQEEIDVVSETNDVLPPSDDDSDDKVDDVVRRNAIVKFNAKVKFGVFNDENDVLSYFMFVIFAKEFSLLSAESEDTIFYPGLSPKMKFSCVGFLEHADYINRMEMLFTINSHPHSLMNGNTNVESFSSFQISNQESEPRQEEIDVVSETNDVLPPSDDDLDDEVDDVGDLRVDNVIQNSKHKFSESEDSDFDNLLLPLPPSEPPNK
nr:hypothetical protein [Tanacetum cinerariifolium]